MFEFLREIAAYIGATLFFVLPIWLAWWLSYGFTIFPEGFYLGRRTKRVYDPAQKRVVSISESDYRYRSY